MAWRDRGCARHQHGLPDPCLRSRDRPFGAADGIGDGVHRAEMAGRGLSLLSWTFDATVAFKASGTGAGCAWCRVAVARILAGRAHRYAQSESRLVLPG